MSVKRIMNRTMLPLAISALCVSAPSTAYETGTHVQITNNAFQISNLGSSPALLQGLGLDLRILDPSPAAPFGHTYFDISDDQVKTRLTFNYYEAVPINALTGDSGFFLQDWLMRGAIREDDLGYNLDGTPNGKDPHDEATPIYRVFNHFYDPVNDTQLNNPGIALLNSIVSLIPLPAVVNSFPSPVKAPDWAIGAKNSFDDPNTPVDPRVNHFTIFDAREAMYRALTLQAEVAGASPSPLFDPTSTLVFDPTRFATMEMTRLKYWATTFRALGDVLHLNQDMAQPQHTRNEAHTGTLESKTLGLSSVFVGHESVYETYIDARVKNDTIFNLKTIDQTVTIGKSSPLTIYDGQYPIPAFLHYTDFWSTAKQGGGVSSGSGLADYSNRGFFTASNNFNLTGNYSLPTSNPFAYNKVLTSPTDWAGSPITGLLASPVLLFNGTVPETASNIGPANNVPLTTLGLWDQFMTGQSLIPSFTLNRVNYDAMAGLLLPRAVAYSAGLLNYFFRGSMVITPPRVGVFGIIDHSALYNNTGRITAPDSRTQGFGTIKLTLTNTTSPATENMSGGVLTAVIKFRRNRQFTDDLTHEPGAPGEDLDAVRGTVEEIVTSTTTRDHTGTPITNAILTQGVAQEFGFDFDQVLPLNATDVTLQVVYRGVLGSETDAIVVGTTNLSAPSYFSYINAFDFIHIGGSVYTFAEVNNNAALLAQVSPTTCIIGQQSPPPVGSLNPNCFSPGQTLSIGLDAVHPTTNPLINVQNMPARHYFRVAMLTAGGSSGQAVLQQNSICVPSTPFTVPGLINAHLAVAGANGPSVSSESSDLSAQRGVLGWFATSCVYNGDNSAVGATDDRVTKWAQTSEKSGPLGPSGGGTQDEIFPFPTTNINFPQYDAP